MPLSPSDQPYQRVPPLLGLDIHNIMMGLAKHTDREAAIVGHALVDAALEAAVRNRLVEKIDTTLFNPNKGVLGTCYAKMAVALSLGILHPDVHCDIQNLSEIRNRFAHSISPLEFSTVGSMPRKGDQRETIDICKQLRTPRNFTPILRWTEDLSDDPIKVWDNGDGRNGFMLIGGIGDVMAEYYEDDFDLKDPKGMYLAATKVCWLSLMKVAMQVRIKAHVGQPPPWLQRLPEPLDGEPAA